MELLIILIFVFLVFSAGYAVAYAAHRAQFQDLRYRLGTADRERQKVFWAHTSAAKKMGVDIESEGWYRALQEEEVNFERENPHHTR
jgi:hypothetical protein